VVVATAFGGPDVLSLVEQAVPPPRSGELTIRVIAAGVNPIDYKLYSGAFGRDPKALPLRLGSEAAGVVTQVGPDALGSAGPIRVGDEVIAYRPGADVAGFYATEITVPAEIVVPKPANLGWEEAAGLLLTGATAVHALSVVGLGQRDTVLIHGVSGGVGRMAAQLAIQRGARVIGTAGKARHESLRRHGVEPVGYGPGLAGRAQERAPGGVHAAIDTVGTDEAVEVSLSLVPDRDRIATIAAFRRGAEAGIKTLGSAPGAADPGTEIRSAARAELVALAAEGKLKVTVARTFPLRQAAAAHELIATGHAVARSSSCREWAAGAHRRFRAAGRRRAPGSPRGGLPRRGGPRMWSPARPRTAPSARWPMPSRSGRAPSRRG